MSRNRLLAAKISGLVVVFLAGMALAGSAALGKDKPTPSSTTSTTSSQTATTAPSSGKVLVCHRTHSKKKPPHTIRVSPHALQAHLNHGDTAGACAATPTTGSTTTTSSSAQTKNGKAKGHDK